MLTIYSLTSFRKQRHGDILLVILHFVKDVMLTTFSFSLILQTKSCCRALVLLHFGYKVTMTISSFSSSLKAISRWQALLLFYFGNDVVLTSCSSSTSQERHHIDKNGNLDQRRPGLVHPKSYFSNLQIREMCGGRIFRLVRHQSWVT